MYIAPLTRQSAPVFCAEDAIFRRCVIFATCDLPSLSHAEERGQLPRSQLSLPKTPSKIHGELLKLGIEVAESTVSIYMVPRRDRPLQTWKTFICNHMEGIARSRNACRRMHSMRASKKVKGHKPRLHASPPGLARAPASQTIQRNRLATAWASSRSNPSRCATSCVRRANSWKTQASTSNVAHGQGAAGVCVSD